MGLIYALACLLCLLLTGCLGQHVKYPPDWASITRGQDKCRAISGTYENKGVVINAGGKSEDTYLTDHMFLPVNYSANKYNEFERVELRYNENKLVVQLKHDSDDYIYAYPTDIVNLRCDEEGLQLNVSISLFDITSGTFPLLSNSSVNMAISKADDGSLVIEEKINIKGLLFTMAPLPILLDDITWHRFNNY